AGHTASRRFQDKTVVVTGAGRGIGAAIAGRFARDGAMVVLADRDLERVTATAARLATSGRTRPFGVDISAPDGADRAVAFALAEFGRLDIVVSNAAIYPFSLIHEITAAE